MIYIDVGLFIFIDLLESVELYIVIDMSVNSCCSSMDPFGPMDPMAGRSDGLCEYCIPYVLTPARMCV